MDQINQESELGLVLGILIDIQLLYIIRHTKKHMWCDHTGLTLQIAVMATVSKDHSN